MLFHFKIKFVTEDGDLFTNVDRFGNVTEEGIVGCNSYGEAAEKVVDYVGRDNVIEISLYECDNPLCYDEIKDMMQEE